MNVVDFDPTDVSASAVRQELGCDSRPYLDRSRSAVPRALFHRAKAVRSRLCRDVAEAAGGRRRR